jgi:hypothetical protein
MIVRRGCQQTFDRLQEMFADDAEIQVVWDRRSGDRRRGDRRQRTRTAEGDASASDADRRRVERRKPVSQSWLTLDFIVAKDQEVEKETT